MQSYTVSFHVGTAVHRDHNKRNPKVVDKQEHIRKDGVCEIWQDETERQAYRRIFGAAVKEYNGKQKRTDRKVNNFWQKIKDDKQMYTCYEALVTIGDKDNQPDKETGKAMLREFYEDWKKRNPNLEIIGCYYHDDEQGAPHLHIDYIPVARCKRGVSLQPSYAKALQEMGYKFKNIHDTEQIQFQNAQRQVLKDICKEHGFATHSPEDQHEHMKTELFKTRQDLEKAKKELNKSRQENKVLKQENEELKKAIEGAEQKNRMQNRQKNIINRWKNIIFQKKRNTSINQKTLTVKNL